MAVGASGGGSGGGCGRPRVGCFTDNDGAKTISGIAYVVCGDVGWLLWVVVSEEGGEVVGCVGVCWWSWVVVVVLVLAVLGCSGRCLVLEVVVALGLVAGVLAGSWSLDDAASGVVADGSDG